MPHADDALPRTPVQADKSPIPRDAAAQSTPAVQAKTGMLPTLSIAEFTPNDRLIDEALGFGPEASKDVDAVRRFQQPKFG